MADFRKKLVEVAHKLGFKVAGMTDDNLMRKVFADKKISKPAQVVHHLAVRLKLISTTYKPMKRSEATALLKKVRASPEFTQFMKPLQNVSAFRKKLVSEARELEIKANRISDDDLIRSIIRQSSEVDFTIIHHLAQKFNVTEKKISEFKTYKSKTALYNEVVKTKEYSRFMKPPTKANKKMHYEMKTSASNEWTDTQILKYAAMLDLNITKAAKNKNEKAIQMPKAKILKDDGYKEILLDDIQDPSEIKRADINWNEVKSVESKFNVQTALNKFIRTHTMVPDQDFKDTLSFFKTIKPYVLEVLQDELEEKRNIKYRIQLKIQNYNPVTEAEDVRYPSTGMTALLSGSDVSSSYDDVVAQLEQRIQDDEAKGSGWAIDKILEMQIIVNQYQPLTGGSYIELPAVILNNKSCINVKNEDDLCFRYAILAALHPPAKDPQRVSKYTSDHDIDFSMLEYPVRVNSINSFETKNKLAINIYSLTKEKIGILRISKAEGEAVNLLLLEEKSKQHYVTIKNMSRFMQLTSPSGSQHKRYPCHKCLHAFTTQGAYETHIEIGCGEIQESLPIEGKNTMQFTNFHKQLPYPFVAVADFEALTVKVKDNTKGATKKYQIHEPCGYAVQLTSDFLEDFLAWDRKMTTVTSIHDDTQFSMNNVKAFTLDRSKNTIENFLLTVNDMAIRTNEYVRQHAVGGNLFKPMVLTEDDHPDDEKHCHICEKPLKLIRRLDHCHFTGKFRGVAHNLCNLNYNYKKTKMTVVFHNFAKYDGHLLIKEIHKIKEMQAYR